MKSLLTPMVDKQIVKIGRRFAEGNLDKNITDDFKILLNTLKKESKCIDCNQISNDLMSVSHMINQDQIEQTHFKYDFYSNIFSLLMEKYIEIIDAKSIRANTLVTAKE